MRDSAQLLSQLLTLSPFSDAALLFVAGRPFAMVNCVECYTTRVLYERVLNALAGHVVGPDNEYGSYAACAKLSVFVRRLAELYADLESGRVGGGGSGGGGVDDEASADGDGGTRDKGKARARYLVGCFQLAVGLPHSPPSPHPLRAPSGTRAMR